RDSSTPDQAAQHVAPQAVGAQPELDVGRQWLAEWAESLAAELADRAVGRDLRCEHEGQPQEQQEDAGGQRQLLPPETAPPTAPPGGRGPDPPQPPRER